MIFPSGPEDPIDYGEVVSGLITSEEDVIKAGFPYANSEGVSRLCTNSDGYDWREEVDSEWILGLNQGITKPEVLREFHDKDNCDVRIFSPRGELNAQNLNRPPFLHGKFISVSSHPASRGSVIITSANMTGAALGDSPTNYELGTVKELTGETWRQYQTWWQGLWSESTPLSRPLIEDYENIRDQIDGTSPEIEGESTISQISDAQDAKYFWINAGGLSGWTRYQMDLERDLAVFFGEPSSGERYIEIEFRGEVYQQKLAPRGDHHWNERWRLHLPTGFPEQDEEFYPYKMVLFKEIRNENGNSRFIMTVCEQGDSVVERWRRHAEKYGVHDQTAPGEQGREFGYW